GVLTEVERTGDARVHDEVADPGDRPAARVVGDIGINLLGETVAQPLKLLPAVRRLGAVFSEGLLHHDPKIGETAAVERGNAGLAGLARHVAGVRRHRFGNRAGAVEADRAGDVAVDAAKAVLQEGQAKRLTVAGEATDDGQRQQAG